MTVKPQPANYNYDIALNKAEDDRFAADVKDIAKSDPDVNAWIKAHPDEIK